MSYAYFPGCGSTGTGRPYEESLVAVFQALGSGLDAIDDWNCCGATAYPTIDPAQATALCARNFALAERAHPEAKQLDVVAPCAGCYRALLKAEKAMAEGGVLAERVSNALGTAGLSYDGRAQPRHPLDVLVNDIGLEAIAAATVRPLQGLRVACYYGCLLVRPYAPFDDPYEPTSMERLFRAMGAEPIDWPLRTRCCGGSCYCGGPIVGALPEATLDLSHTLLEDAKKRGADVVVTTCPLCQFNLEGFQSQMARTFGARLDVTVGFFSQLLGLALGIEDRKLGIQRMFRWKLPEQSPKDHLTKESKEKVVVDA
jgi:heterodisulfide reductase subunit B